MHGILLDKRLVYVKLYNVMTYRGISISILVDKE